MALKTDPPNPDKGGGEPSPRPKPAPSPRISPRDAKSVGGKGATPAVPQAGIHPSVQPKAPAASKTKETTPDLFSFAEEGVAEPTPAPALKPEPKLETEPLPEPKAHIPVPSIPVPAPAVEPEPKEAAAPVVTPPAPAPPATVEEEIVFIPGPPRPQPQAQPQLKAEAKAEARIEHPKQPSVQPPPEKPAMATPTPQHIDDFRRNAERQKKEQQSFGNVLATVTYSILVAFILVTGLAGYGGYILFKKVELQRMTLAELDRRYEAEVVGLKEDLARSHAETAKLGDVVTAQQEQIARLRAAIDKVNAEQFRNYSALKAQVDQLEAQPRPGIR